MPSIALIVCIVGGAVFVISRLMATEGDKLLTALGELGKWSFIIGLAAYLWFLK